MVLAIAALVLFSLGFGVMRGKGLLRRVRRALQRHRGRLPDLHARSGRQHPRKFPGRHSAGCAGRPHTGAGVGEPRLAGARRNAGRPPPRRRRIAVWLASVVVAFGLSVAWSMDTRQGDNEYEKALSANGLFSLGYAFGNNEIDYFDSYAARPQKAARRSRSWRVSSPPHRRRTSSS